MYSIDFTERLHRVCTRVFGLSTLATQDLRLYYIILTHKR